MLLGSVSSTRQGAAVHAAGGYGGDLASIGITPFHWRTGLFGRIGGGTTGSQHDGKKRRNNEFFTVILQSQKSRLFDERPPGWFTHIASADGETLLDAPIDRNGRQHAASALLCRNQDHAAIGRERGIRPCASR